MERQALLEAIRDRMGATDVAEAEHALWATWPALTWWLDQDDAMVIAAEFPEELYQSVRRGRRICNLEEFLGRVTRSPGCTREHALAVVHAIHGHLSASAKRQLTSTAWAELMLPAIDEHRSASVPPAAKAHG